MASLSLLIAPRDLYKSITQAKKTKQLQCVITALLAHVGPEYMLKGLDK